MQEIREGSVAPSSGGEDASGSEDYGAPAVVPESKATAPPLALGQAPVGQDAALLPMPGEGLSAAPNVEGSTGPKNAPFGGPSTIAAPPPSLPADSGPAYNNSASYPGRGTIAPAPLPKDLAVTTSQLPLTQVGAQSILGTPPDSLDPSGRA